MESWIVDCGVVCVSLWLLNLSLWNWIGIHWKERRKTIQMETETKEEKNEIDVPDTFNGLRVHVHVHVQVNNLWNERDEKKQEKKNDRNWTRIKMIYRKLCLDITDIIYHDTRNEKKQEIKRRPDAHFKTSSNSNNCNLNEHGPHATWHFYCFTHWLYMNEIDYLWIENWNHFGGIYSKIKIQ